MFPAAVRVHTRARDARMLGASSWMWRQACLIRTASLVRSTASNLERDFFFDYLIIMNGVEKFIVREIRDKVFLYDRSQEDHDEIEKRETAFEEIYDLLLRKRRLFRILMHFVEGEPF